MKKTRVEVVWVMMIAGVGEEADECSLATPHHLAEEGGSEMSIQVIFDGINIMLYYHYEIIIIYLFVYLIIYYQLSLNKPPPPEGRLLIQMEYSKLCY